MSCPKQPCTVRFSNGFARHLDERSHPRVLPIQDSGRVGAPNGVIAGCLGRAVPPPGRQECTGHTAIVSYFERSGALPRDGACLSSLLSRAARWGAPPGLGVTLTGFATQFGQAPDCPRATAS